MATKRESSADSAFGSLVVVLSLRTDPFSVSATPVRARDTFGLHT